MPADATLPDEPRAPRRPDLQKYFPIHKGFLRRVVGHVRAVDDVCFDIAEGETLALVGESGCGKTTTSRCILRAIDPTAGEILVLDHEAGEGRRRQRSPARELRRLRRDMQMIFQDPFSSLNPRMTLLDIVGEPLLQLRHDDRAQRPRGAGRGAAAPGRPAPGVHAAATRTPSAAASGSASASPARWRCNPRLVVADEPVSALDVSVQAQILNLLMRPAAASSA